MDFLVGLGTVEVTDCLESGLRSYSGYLVDMEGQVGHLLPRSGDLCAEVRCSLVADWCWGSTGFEETVVLRSRTCHSSSVVKQEKKSISL